MNTSTYVHAISSDKSAHLSENVHWQQLLSLTALYASIIIGWIAYYNYQPILLETYRFQNLSFLLVIAQGIILVVTPVFAGRIGDRYRFSKGHRLPIIAAGISFTAMIFMAVAFSLLASPGESFRWIFPILIVSWLFGMSLFTSPALSTMELFTPVEKIPRAMAVLTIVSNLLYALEPVIIDLINFLGAPVTFMVGGLAVLISGYALKKTSLHLFKNNGEPAPPKYVDKRARARFSKVFIQGVVLGLVTTVLFNVLPGVLHTRFSFSYSFIPQAKWLLVGILVLSALVSWPASYLVTKIGTYKAYRGSALVSILSLALLLIPGFLFIAVPLLIIFIIAFTVLAVSALPLAMQRAGYYQKVLCVGIFFAGVEVPNGILEALLAYY